MTKLSQKLGPLAVLGLLATLLANNAEAANYSSGDSVLF